MVPPLIPFSWIRLPICDPNGVPQHQGGISPVPGLYLVGFPWLRTRKSGIISGVDEDAAHIVEHIVTR
jgi:putative flavoprotein involved in K+ transport